jgi:hypothetical protein
VERLDRGRCRDFAAKRFSVAAMAEGYEQVYRGVI